MEQSRFKMSLFLHPCALFPFFPNALARLVVTKQQRLFVNGFKRCPQKRTRVPVDPDQGGEEVRHLSEFSSLSRTVQGPVCDR